MSSYSEIFLYFLKLGFTGFGGPVALTAIMQKELVEERGWITREQFDQAFPLIKAMPGALAVMTCSYLSYKRRGFVGALCGAIGLLLPAFTMMILLAIAAPAMAELNWLQPLLMGFQAGALALIALACLQLATPYRSQKLWWVYVAATLGLSFAHVPEPLLILSFGALNVFIMKRKRLGTALFVVPLLELMLVCFSAGAFVFGTGLAAIPFLENQMVFKNQWISQHEFLQAVAFGQITPGPVTVTATYIGYKISGFMGALFGTIAIYLPGFIHMTTWFPRMVTNLSKKSWIRDFSQGALGAVVGTLIYVVIRYVPSVGARGAIIFAIASVVLIRFKIPAWLMIIVCGAVGYLISFV